MQCTNSTAVQSEQVEARTAQLNHVPAIDFLLPENNGVYKFTCPRGRANSAILRAEKFEVLF